MNSLYHLRIRRCHRGILVLIRRGFEVNYQEPLPMSLWIKDLYLIRVPNLALTLNLSFSK